MWLTVRGKLQLVKSEKAPVFACLYILMFQKVLRLTVTRAIYSQVTMFIKADVQLS